MFLIMENERINEIISESINDYLLKEDKNEISKILKDGLKKLKSLKNSKKKMHDNGPKMKSKKVVGGTTKRYNYDDYQRQNKSVSKADINQIIDTIDQDLTDIAAVAKMVFPDHTDEGAQSQLRKILNHERPMTKRVAEVLQRLISSGAIAVKQ